MKALIVSHEAGTKPGVVGDRLAERGVECRLHVMVPDTSRPDLFDPLPTAGAGNTAGAAGAGNTAGFDLLVVLGSYWSVYGDAASTWIESELDLIRRSHKAGTPVLGICFGGQALAQALGGSVERSPETEIGWFRITAADGVELPISEGPWMEWHHDRFELPPGAQLMATTRACPQLFRIGRSVGTQFHPEITSELASDWMREVTEDYLDSCGVSREQVLADVARHEEANRRNCSQLVDWFLDEVATS